MVASIFHKGKSLRVDFYHPIDISMPLDTTEERTKAWYVSPVKIEPVKTEGWIGDVNSGGSVNFRNIFFNPHGNGTHTECVGHISKENYSINQCLKQFMFLAELITILPKELENGDKIISRNNLKLILEGKKAEALIIRTISNAPAKLFTNYSNTNPPYLTTDAIDYILELGYEHVLIDLPSIDKEVDGGALAAHHRFWNYPAQPALNRTITELIYVPNDVYDGSYLLNLQIASFENDASPSKPVIYKIN
jgi:kynurenine formamidase